MKLPSKAILYTLYFCFLFISPNLLEAQTYAKNGMVVSASKISSQTGIDILKQGGNAIDAAIATAFSLAVTHPTAGNIGGGGFMVLMNAQGEVTTIDFREKAPLASSENMFLDEEGKIKDNSNHRGLLATGVPGTVAGLYLAHQKYGKLAWKDLVQPAIDLAENGFIFNWNLYRAAKRFSKVAEQYPFMATYFNNGQDELTQPNEIWKQSALANTLKQIRDKGRDGFYKGEIAKKIDTYMKANGGIITSEDLEKYEAIERKPIKGTYKGYDIYGMPPPSSGGVALIEMMNIMELVDWDKISLKQLFRKNKVVKEINE